MALLPERSSDGVSHEGAAACPSAGCTAAPSPPSHAPQAAAASDGGDKEGMEGEQGGAAGAPQMRRLPCAACCGCLERTPTTTSPLPLPPPPRACRMRAHPGSVYPMFVAFLTLLSTWRLFIPCPRSAGWPETSLQRLHYPSPA